VRKGESRSKGHSSLSGWHELGKSQQEENKREVSERGSEKSETRAKRGRSEALTLQRKSKERNVTKHPRQSGGQKQIGKEKKRHAIFSDGRMVFFVTKKAWNILETTLRMGNIGQPKVVKHQAIRERKGGTEEALSR